jgi:hypothetical protein
VPEADIVHFAGCGLSIRQGSLFERLRSDRYLCAYKNQAHLKEKSGISARSLADEKVCDRWRKRENATLKKLEILAFGLATIPLLASLWWTADSTKKTEALNPDRMWLLDAD